MTIMNKRQKAYIPTHLSSLPLLAMCLCAACSGHQSYSPDRETTDSLVRLAMTEQQLDSLFRLYDNQHNQLGMITVLRELGQKQRNESRFEDALKTHNRGLILAEAADDTIETVRALNNLGTDYRRLGVLDAATTCHYQALKICEENKDTSAVARKNRVISLNGLANIYLSTGNYQRADSVLRLALAGEQSLGSHLGQAINYANLGAIHEHYGNMDSALIYYRQSMRLNEQAGSSLGIALCHTNIGGLYAKKKQYDLAAKEYDRAYALMHESKDEWHALNVQIAMAKLYMETKHYSHAMSQLDDALKTAGDIKSVEHQAEIYQAYYLLHKQQGKVAEALRYHEKATALQDSVVDMEKINRIQNASLQVERERRDWLVGKANEQYAKERSVRVTSFTVFVVIVVLFAILLAALAVVLRARVRSQKMMQRLSRVRETFFTNVTHEFRSPLTIILGLSNDLASSDSLPQTMRSKAGAIERHGNNMLLLINQLLDISKVKSAIGEADWRHGNIVTYMSMVVDSYTETAQHQAIALTFDSRWKNIEMDFVPDYMQKILNNLISNAFKFTDEGGSITVGISRMSNKKIELFVADTGVGISEEDQKQIFEPFYQAKGDARHLGTGIGLSLVSQVVKAMDGTIKVHSVVGKGTTFTIVLPLRHGGGLWKAYEGTVVKPQTISAGDMPIDVTPGNSQKPLVLIIEDNTDVAQLIGSRLLADYDVCYASDGYSGLKKAEQLVPDIIITDLMMPGMSGLEVCRQIRSNELTSHIPIIIVSARVTDEDRIKGLEMGADAYLCKPFNDEELRVRVKKLLEQRRRLQEKYSKMLSGNGADEEVESKATTPANTYDQQFLQKVADAVCLLMDRRQLDVNALASKMCVSPRQLHRKMVALTGQPPSAYIQVIKMKRACYLLKHEPQVSLEEIADRLGFDHYSGFFHAFKKATGVSPKKYRQDACH